MNRYPLVLIVEDEAVQRFVLSELLESEGFTVIGARDGEHAIRLVTAGVRPDAAVLDFTLPRMSAPDLLGRLGTLSGWAGVPALIVTGHPDVRAVRAARAVFQKPYSFEELLNGLRRALEARP